MGHRERVFDNLAEVDPGVDETVVNEIVDPSRAIFFDQESVGCMVIHNNTCTIRSIDEKIYFSHRFDTFLSINAKGYDMTSYQIDVVNIKTVRDFGTRAGDVYIGRRFGKHPGSPFANPFKIGVHGDRNDVIAKYRDYLISTGLVNKLPDLLDHGTTIRLGCWCAPAPCHGDVLKDYLIRYLAEKTIK